MTENIAAPIDVTERAAYLIQMVFLDWLHDEDDDLPMGDVDSADYLAERIRLRLAKDGIEFARLRSAAPGVGLPPDARERIAKWMCDDIHPERWNNNNPGVRAIYYARADSLLAAAGLATDDPPVPERAPDFKAMTTIELTAWLGDHGVDDWSNKQPLIDLCNKVWSALTPVDEGRGE